MQTRAPCPRKKRPTILGGLRKRKSHVYWHSKTHKTMFWMRTLKRVTKAQTDIFCTCVIASFRHICEQLISSGRFRVYNDYLRVDRCFFSVETRNMESVTNKGKDCFVYCENKYMRYAVCAFMIRPQCFVHNSNKFKSTVVISDKQHPGNTAKLLKYNEYSPHRIINCLPKWNAIYSITPRYQNGSECKRTFSPLASNWSYRRQQQRNGY